MAKKEHQYSLSLQWTGARGPLKERFYTLDFGPNLQIEGSADKPFLGDESKLNPEQMLLGALTSCHMMSFFYVCRQQKIQVNSYQDQPVGFLSLNKDGSGQFDRVILKPRVLLEQSVTGLELRELHKAAGKLCFIANSVNFKIDYSL